MFPFTLTLLGWLVLGVVFVVGCAYKQRQLKRECD